MEGLFTTTWIFRLILRDLLVLLKMEMLIFFITDFLFILISWIY